MTIKDQEVSEPQEESPGEAKKGKVYLEFTQDVFDSIYNSVELVATLTVETRGIVDEFMQIATDLDRRLDLLEAAAKLTDGER
mgnify:CR=1 FL=1|tara:strand:- start:1768 stop:2016 length:249 start_codon:yes stop_codon:yes gene_type:complete